MRDFDDSIPSEERVKHLRIENPRLGASDIARQLGLSRERVRQILLKLALDTDVRGAEVAAHILPNPLDDEPGEVNRGHDARVTLLPSGLVGAWGEMLVCADLMARGFDVYRALASMARCDLVAIHRATGRVVRIESRLSKRSPKGRVNVPSDSRNRGFRDVIACVVSSTEIVYVMTPEAKETVESAAGLKAAVDAAKADART